MRFILVAGIAFALVILGSRYVRSNGLRKGKPMVEEATSLISRGSLVIDVRQEACQGYVKGAHLISIEDILAKSPKALDQFQKLNPDKNKPMAFYCTVGGRAGKVIKAMQELGYTNLQNLGGVGDYYDEKFMEKCK